MEHLLEICVDSLESALAAQEGGADRLELCANLLIGGTSPSMGLVRQVLREVHIPVNVLLRPRFGDFCFTPSEKELTLWEVEQCRSLGANGVVLGALLPDGTLDASFLAECIAASPGMNHTLHRAFDLCRDPFEGLEQALALGFDTILTSGQQAKAPRERSFSGSWWTAPPAASPSLPGAASARTIWPSLPARACASSIFPPNGPCKARWSSAATASPWGCRWRTSTCANMPTPP